MKNVLRKLFYYGAAAIGVSYYATIGRLLWHGSTLSIYQRSGEVIPCPVCGSRDSGFFCLVPIFKDLSLFDERGSARRIYNLSFLPDWKIKTEFKKWERFALSAKKSSIDYYKCHHCDNYFQNTPVDSVARSAYFSQFYRNTRKFGRPHAYKSGSRYHLWAEYLREQAGLQEGARVLDIGCAEGFQVLRFKEMGCDAYGIEPSEPMVRYGRENLGLDNLIAGSYTINSYPGEFFDLITSYHVVEHLDDYKAFFEAAFFHLKSGGYFVVSTPCVEAAYEHYKTGTPVEDLRNVLGGGHHVLFSYKCLSDLMKKRGFVLLNNQFVDKEKLLLPGKKTAPSGEKWLGMNIIAKKPS